MNQLKQLLKELEQVTFDDISEIPADYRHQVLLQIEELQDQLKKLDSSKQ